MEKNPRKRFSAASNQESPGKQGGGRHSPSKRPVADDTCRPGLGDRGGRTSARSRSRARRRCRRGGLAGDTHHAAKGLSGGALIRGSLRGRSRVLLDRSGAGRRGVDDGNHAVLAVLALRAVQPDWIRVVDADRVSANLL